MPLRADGAVFVNFIAITSGKGGTGKSCVTAYTGIALAQAGKKTLLVEAGGDGRSLDLMAAAQPESVFDLGDVLSEGCELQDAVVVSTYTENLFLLPAPLDGLHPDPALFSALLKLVKKEYDFILVDGADLLSLSPKLFAPILMVTTPDSLSVRACQNLTRKLYAAGAQEIRLVINNVPPQRIPIQGAQDFDDVIDCIGAQLIAVLPHSPRLACSANNAERLESTSLPSRIFDRLAARLCGQTPPLLLR